MNLSRYLSISFPAEMFADPRCTKRFFFLQDGEIDRSVMERDCEIASLTAGGFGQLVAALFR